MKAFEIINTYHGGHKVVAMLYYDSKKDEYTIEIPKDADVLKLPMILGAAVKNGKYKLTGRQSRRWVTDRLIPPNRQNIGSILKKLGLTYYDEIALLEINEGRTIQDDFIVKRCDLKKKQ